MVKDTLTFEQKNQMHLQKMEEYSEYILQLKKIISKFEEMRKEEEMQLTS